MKKLLLTMALGAACSAAFAQGTLNFANAAAGVNAPVTVNNSATRASGNTYTVDLYWGPAGTTLSGSLTPLGSSAIFNAGAQSGYFTGGSRTVNGVAGGTSIVVQIRGWQTTLGSTTFATWAQAQSGGAAIGNSGLFNITLATPPATPVNLVGLTSFDIHGGGVVPEPSSFALAGIGAAALLIFRRRK